MKEELISVVVPIYNVEKYLSKCVDSLLNQTYKNLEIILVNDCSKDNSGEIAKDYAKKHKNITFIQNEKNSGLAFTRNAGMKIAKGDYIGFIDSDDYVDKDFYEKLMDAMKTKNAEVAMCDMKLVYENENNREVVCPSCDGKFNLINVINNGLVASACNKLFKKDLVSKYEFAVGKVNEDIAVVIPALVNAKKIAYARETYYNYVQRENSIQNSKFSEKRFDIIEAVDTTLERIKDHPDFEDLKEALIFNQIIVLFIYVIPKDNRFFYRYKVLTKFNKLTKKYNIRSNKYFWMFMNGQSRKNKLYFKTLFKSECSGLYLFTDLLISFYRTYSKFSKKSVIKKDADMNDLIEAAKKQQNLKEVNKTVSVVVPNYNYERFMYQRLYSILRQSYKINEIIILDDCSKDNSRKLIDKIIKELKSYIDIKRDFNEKNSGTTFKQWEKGFKLAKSDYVWIAEADDYCESNLLKELMKPVLSNDNVRISYSDTAFVDADGVIKMRSVRPLIDIMQTGHWNDSYVNDGLDEIKNYTFLNCTIANVSSCVIKNDDYSKYLKISCDYRQAGDWIFYANVMSEGKVAYTNKRLNYYREHGTNVSSTFKRQNHLDEIKSIHSYYENTFGLNKKQKDEIEKRYEFLIEAWNLNSEDNE